MTTLREAAEMALIAMEEAVEYAKYIRADHYMRPYAIENLRKALEQPEHTEQPIGMVSTCKECLPVEREPVACVQDLDEVKRKHLVYEKGMDWKDALYTHPPKREWQGLTDEEIKDIWCWDEYLHSYQQQMIQDIEAKLKEKNT